MNKKFALIILCMFIFLCACNRHAEKTEQTPMTKAEMLDLSFVLTPDRIEKPLNNLTTAKKVFGPIRIWDTVASYLSRDLIGNVYTFNGIVHSVESDHRRCQECYARCRESVKGGYENEKLCSEPARKDPDHHQGI